MPTDSNQSNSTAPVNPLPPVVIALALAVALPELLFTFAAQGWLGDELLSLRTSAAEVFGFFIARVDWMIEAGTLRLAYLWPFFTYPFIQAEFMQAIFVAVFVLALGKMIAEALGQAAVLVIFFGGSVLGALVYAAISDSQIPLFGGYPGAFALIGAFSFTLWQRLRASGGQVRQAFGLFGLFTLILIGYGVFLSPGIVWIAQLVGLWVGFLIAYPFYPGNWSRILNRIRARG